MNEIIDLTKQARALTRARRTGHRHVWVEGRGVGHSGKRGRVERCTLCGDQFPCRGYHCHHLDCIERGFELGQRTGFPRDYQGSLIVLGEGHVSDDMCPACVRGDADGHYEYHVKSWVDPAEWITKIPLEPARKEPADGGGDQR